MAITRDNPRKVNCRSHVCKLFWFRELSEVFFCVCVQPERCSQVPPRPYFGLFSDSGFCTFAPVWRGRGIPVPAPILGPVAGWPFVFLACLPACLPAFLCDCLLFFSPANVPVRAPALLIACLVLAFLCSTSVCICICTCVCLCACFVLKPSWPCA